MGGRVVGDGACAESGGNVDGIVECDRVCTLKCGPGGARGTGRRKDVLHGGLEDTFVLRWLV